jgi:hypothetical protein
MTEVCYRREEPQREQSIPNYLVNIFANISHFVSKVLLHRSLVTLNLMLSHTLYYFFANLCEIEPEKMYVEAKKKIAIYFLANFLEWRCDFLVEEVWILVVEFHTFFRVRMANILPYEIGHSLGVLLTYRGENTQQDWESIIGKHIG